jgi:hypothetical protein
MEASRRNAVWRDPFGFHVQARLPAPPNWVTLHRLIDLAADIARRLLRADPHRENPASPIG